MHSSLFAAGSSDTFRFADVILPLNLPQILTYGITSDLQGVLRPGMRVEVSLGRNKQYAGIVERLHDDQPEGYQVKPIKGILDEEPVVNDVQLRFWKWISSYYMAAPGEVMQAALPAHMKLMAETRLEWIGEPDVFYEWSNETHIAADALMARRVRWQCHSVLDGSQATEDCLPNFWSARTHVGQRAEPVWTIADYGAV